MQNTYKINKTYIITKIYTYIKKKSNKQFSNNFCLKYK